MKTQESVKQLMRFPLHIVQKITRSSSRDKSALVADFAFRLDAMDIYLEQSPIADNGIVVKAFGKQIARIDATRGKQEYKLVETGAEWLKDWDTLLDDLMLLAIAVGEDKPFGDDEPTPADRANAIVQKYFAKADHAYTDAQRLLVTTHGTIGERLLANLDERFEVEIVENRLEITDTTTNIAVLVEYNREAGTWMGYQSNGQLWAVTGKPRHHLELITKGFI